MSCIVAGCTRKATLVPLPMIDRRVWVCAIHRGARFLATMAALVAHG